MPTASINPRIINQLARTGLFEEGHFRYDSGKHSSVRFNRDRLLVDPDSASSMGYALAKAFFTSKVETIASPSIWGAGLAQWVAWFLEPRASVVVASTSPDGSLSIAPGLNDLIAGKRILLIDNLVFTGETIDRTSQLITSLGGEVIGLGCLWSESDRIAPYPVESLLNAAFPVWHPIDCPLCLDPLSEVDIVAW